MGTTKGRVVKKPPAAKTNGHKPEVVTAPPWHIPIRSTEVAILGFAPASMLLAPFDNPNIEIWGLNEIYIAPGVRRIDRLFEMHNHKYLTMKQRNPKHLEWLQNAKIPIYMLEKYKDIPGAIKFPWEYVVEQTGTQYYTNTVSWMIAFAVLEGARKISLYGIDMARSEEYEYQRPSVEYFVGWARGLGVEVYIPPESDILLTTFMYAIEDPEDRRIQAKITARKKEISTAIQNLQNQSRSVQSQLDQYIGAHQELMQQEKAYMPMRDARWKTEE